jgi:3-oxoacyl-[acyl-carrier-protein] synthase-3
VSVDVFIDHPSFALGEQVFTAAESVASGRTVTDLAGLTKAGFVRHHVAAAQTTSFDLAKAAVEPITGKLGDVDAIIYATCLPLNGNVAPPEQYARTMDVKYLMDYPASRLQAHFQLDRAQVIGINQQACTSLLGSLRLARALMNAEEDCQRILCLTADRFPEGALYEQAYNLISDGAAAVVVSREPSGFRILATHQITNGALVIASDDETVGTYFSYTHRLITETLARAGLTPKQIDWVVPQNTNILAWKVLSGIFGLPAERIWSPSLPEVGHMISGDNIVNLADLLASGRLRAGERLLLVMAGYGLNWQATVLEAV